MKVPFYWTKEDKRDPSGLSRKFDWRLFWLKFISWCLVFFALLLVTVLIVLYFAL